MKLIVTIVLSAFAGLLANWVTSRWAPNVKVKWLITAFVVALALLIFVSLLPDSINNRYNIREESFGGTSFVEAVPPNNLVCMTTGPAQIETESGLLTFRGGDHGTSVCWIGPQTVRVHGLEGASLKRVSISSGDAVEIAQSLINTWGNEMTQSNSGCGTQSCKFIDLAMITSDGRVLKP